MEIDPRLNASRDSNAADGAQNGHSYATSRQIDAAAAPSAQPAGEYPDPPSSHFSPSDQVHSASSASSNGYYGAASTPQALYPNDPPNDPFADLKRPRACEACRQLKVRCEPDANNSSGTCKRCAKAGRTCIVTAPTRKRQKKTDSRVAELERKIDALTASLQASQSHELLLQSGPVAGAQRDEHQGRRWLGASQNGSNGLVSSGSSPVNLAGSKRRSSGEVKDLRENGAVYPRASSPLKEPVRDNAPSKHWRGPWSSSQSVPRSLAGPEVVDVVDRGLVSLAVASDAFDRYVTQKAPHMPFVVFAPGMRMSDVRKSKPVLFHAIVATSVGAIQPDAHVALLDDLYKVIAERIVVKGEKSLELVQALVVACNWYTPPDHFEELKFYQLTHMAVTLAMDLGMNRKMLTRNKPPVFKDLALKKPSSLDPDSPETRRTWLGCYFMAVQVAVSLRRVLLVRWQPYMDECVEILEKSPDTLPSDRAVVQWAKLAHLTEDINFQFATEDAVSSMPFSNPKVQYTLKVFEKQLEQWKKETAPEVYTPIMKQSEYIVNIYMHENAMLMDSGDDRRKASEDYAGATSAAHMSALTNCMTSIHQVLDTVCSVDIKDLVSLPTVCLARASFAAVSLIKLYSIVSFPESQIGQVIDPTSLKVEHYLDKVIEHYSAAGEIPGGRTPGKFSVVLAMLRSWFVKRKDHNQALREAFGAGPVSCDSVNLESEGDKAQSDQTPLHLLSEVAIKEPNNRPVTTHALPQHRPGYTPTEPITQAPSDLPPGLPSNGTTDSTPWASYPPVTLPVSSATTQPHAQTRHFYPFNSHYQDTPYTDSGSASSSNAMILPQMNQGFFVPELGMQVGFDSGSMFALENLLGEGLLNLPLPAEGGMGYY